MLAGGLWLRRRVASRFLAAWGALALPLAREASWAMTEAVFALCSVLALTNLEAHLREGGRAPLLRAAAFAALACLTRYMGLALVAAAVPLLLLRPGPAPASRARGAAAYALIALAPVGFWIARNLALGAGPLGRREPSRASLPEASGAPSSRRSAAGSCSRSAAFPPPRRPRSRCSRSPPPSRSASSAMPATPRRGASAPRCSR